MCRPPSLSGPLHHASRGRRRCGRDSTLSLPCEAPATVTLSREAPEIRPPDRSSLKPTGVASRPPAAFMKNAGSRPRDGRTPIAHGGAAAMRVSGERLHLALHLAFHVLAHHLHVLAHHLHLLRGHLAILHLIGHHLHVLAHHLHLVGGHLPALHLVAHRLHLAAHHLHLLRSHRSALGVPRRRHGDHEHHHRDHPHHLHHSGPPIDSMGHSRASVRPRRPSPHPLPASLREPASPAPGLRETHKKNPGRSP